MKIAFVCPDDLSVTLFCKGLVNTIKNDNRVRICIISGYSKGFENYAREIKSWGNDHIHVSMYRFLNPLKDLRYLLSLFKIYRKRKIEIAVHWTTKPNIYGPISAKMAGVKKTIIAVRGLGSVFQQETNLKGKLLKLLVLKFYRIACRLSNVVWFTNENDLKYFISSGVVNPPKVILTKNAIDIEYYSPFSVQEDKLISLRKEFGFGVHDKVVVMVARMIWPKGIKEFIEASEILKVKYQHVKFVLVAPLETGSPLSVPESYLKEKQKTDNFLWLGFRKDVREIYALSDLAVLPSYYKEGGYPRALLEPMAMGKPVITTDTPDCRGPVEEGKNGYLVPVKDSKSLADAIEKLIMVDELVRISDQCLITLGRFRIDATGNLDRPRWLPSGLYGSGEGLGGT